MKHGSYYKNVACGLISEIKTPAVVLVTRNIYHLQEHWLICHL